MSSGWGSDHVGNYAKIKINDEQIKLNPNTNGTDHGLHIVVLKAGGKVKSSQIFATNESSHDLDTFIDTLTSNDIIIASSLNDCTTKLS